MCGIIGLFFRKLESLNCKLETPPLGEFSSDSSSLAAGVADGAGVGKLACVEIGCSHPAVAARRTLCGRAVVSMCAMAGSSYEPTFS